MLIKYSQTDKRVKLNAICKQQRNSVMKGPSGGGVAPRPHRKAMKGGSLCSSGPLVSKRASAPQKRLPSVVSDGIIGSRRRSEEGRATGGGIVSALDTCDNSNDSGLGFEHPSEVQKITPASITHSAASNSHLLHFDGQEESWDNHCPEVKRQRLCIKMERPDESSSDDSFSVFSVGSRAGSQVSGLGQQPQTVVTMLPNNSIRTVAQAKVAPAPGKSQSLKRKASQGNSGQGCHASGALTSSVLLPPRGPDGNYPLTAQLPSSTLIKNESGPHSLAQLLILAQPESQHRARYQTEGSRGAVKDRSGNGFPIVKLVGFTGTAKLQVFIGTDLGRVAPHMFYQACRVSGKNSTPCSELKVDGTILIEVDFDPSKDMVITCDCVGILKERNVDVEHRFPEQSAGRSKKKSTRCRMVFRASLKLPNGSTETLQAISQPIVCTQPPGVPEICKKSLTSCGCGGGAELFILGKNFLKDTRVVFRMGRGDVDDGGGGSASEEEDGGDSGESFWEEQVIPDREFLQPTHLVCVVPPFRRRDLSAPVQVRLLVTSSGKKSEAHAFTYTPEVLPSSSMPQATSAKALVSSSGCGVSPTSPATPTTTPLSSPTQIAAPTICTLGAVSSSPMVVPADASENGLCEGKLAVTLISPAVGGGVTLSTANQHAEHIHRGIPLSIEVNPHFAKVEPAELPASSPGVTESTVISAGVSGLPALGRSFISCHPVSTSQGVSGAKEEVHPVVLWSTEGSTGTEVIKVLSTPLQLSSTAVPSESSVRLPHTDGLTGQSSCSNHKEAMSVAPSCLTSSATVSDDIPKTQGNLMVSSSSEANLIKQFVSNNISSPLPAQSGQSVEKFLSRIEGEQKPPLPMAAIKVETTQSHVTEELPLKTSSVVNHLDVSSSPVAPSLPSNLVVQFASVMQNQPLDQKITAEQQVASVQTESPTAVSPHTLVLESLTHSMSGVLTSPSSAKTNSATPPVAENQAESGSVSSTTPCSIDFVKPLQDQSLSSIPISTDMCTHNMGNTMAVTSAKICPKEQLDICGLSLVHGISSNPISSEVRTDDIPPTVDQNCIIGMQNPPLSLSVPMQPSCGLASDAIAAALTDETLGTASEQPISQALPQLNLEHNNTMPIVSSAAIMHDVMTPPSGPSPPKEQIDELGHGCGTISPNDSISLSVSNPVTNAELVQRLEHSMTIQTNDLQIGPGMVSNSCSLGSSHSNENIGTRCQNLSIDNPVTVMAASEMEVCQGVLQSANKDVCRSDNIPLTSLHSVAFSAIRMPVHPLARKDIEDQYRAQNRAAAALQRVLKEELPCERIIPSEANVTPVLSQTFTQPQLQLAVTVGPRKCGEDGGMVPQELTQMSDHDLLSYINPSCFDQV